jgi:hypothetical protein
MIITHDIKNHKFFCIVDGLECFASYIVIDYKVLDFNHTFVPPQLRNKGIAAKIFDEVLKYLAENDIKIIPSCSYAEKYFSEHREFIAKI